MAQPNDTFKLGSSYFHSMSKVRTHGNQYVFESPYKTSHTITAKEVWTDTIDYCSTILAADAFTTSNPTIVRKYTLQLLTEVPGSNGEAYYIDNTGTFVRPWISPVDVPNATTNLPSFGFEAKLYRNNNVEISPTEGVWAVDFYAGIVRFQPGYTPASMGYGVPKISCYVYIGQTLADNTTTNIGFPIELNRKIIEIPITSVDGDFDYQDPHVFKVGDYITDVYIDITSAYDMADSTIEVAIYDATNSVELKMLISDTEVDPTSPAQYLNSELHKFNLPADLGHIRVRQAIGTSTGGTATIYVIYVTTGDDRGYGQYSIASQSAWSIGTPLEFDNRTIGNIDVIGSHFQLKANKTYKLMGAMAVTGTDAFSLQYIWHDLESGVNIGNLAIASSVSATSTANSAYSNIAHAYIHTYVDQTVILEVVNAVSINGILPANCFIAIEEISMQIQGGTTSGGAELNVQIINELDSVVLEPNTVYVMNNTSNKTVTLPTHSAGISNMIFKKVSDNIASITILPPVTVPASYIDIDQPSVVLLGKNDTCHIIHKSTDYFTI